MVRYEVGQNAVANVDAGTWTAQAEFIAPKSFSDYAEKSNTGSFTVQSSTLTITAGKDSVVRSNPFTVTISGKAQTIYAVFIEDSFRECVLMVIAIFQEVLYHNPARKRGMFAHLL